MKLHKKIEPSLLKMKRRLEKEGIPNIASLDYEKYRGSTLWKEIRQWVLKRDNFQCVICKQEQLGRALRLEVHHRSYDLEVLEGKRSNQLITLCPMCHERIEFYPNKSKRSDLKEKDEEYLKLKSLHEEIENNGLPILIRKTSGKSLEITYTGKSEYLQFYSISGLARGYVLYFYSNNSDNSRIPIGRKHKQPSKVLDKETGKVIFSTDINGSNKATIKVSKTFNYSVTEQFSTYVSKQKYWRIKQ